MFVKWLLFFVALWANSWLWGHWSLDQSFGKTLMLVGATLILMFLILFPIRYYINKREIKVLLNNKWMQTLFYTYVLMIIILSITSFTGLIQYLLPIKIILLAIYAFLKFKLKKKTQITTPTPTLPKDPQ